MREQPDTGQRIPGIHGQDRIEPIDDFDTTDDDGPARPRLNKVWWALLWLVVIVLAIAPIPWW